jgi:hypothetical protein
VLVPANWALTVQDFETGSRSTWTDPADPNRRLVTATGAEMGMWLDANGQNPYPSSFLPPAAHVYQASTNVFDYSAQTADNRYPDNGVWVAMQGTDGTYNGYQQADLWLSDSQHRLATTILNSFTKAARAAGRGETVTLDNPCHDAPAAQCQ